MKQAINQYPAPLPSMKVYEAAKRHAKENARKFAIPLIFVLVHVPLGLLLYRFSFLALLHPILTFCVGLYWAARPKEPLVKVAWVTAYIVGSEVLWRMSGSSIYWEFGKYSIAAIMLVALVRRQRWKIPVFPLFYFAFLIPSTLLTIYLLDFSSARGKISFNMSGPLLILASSWFFSQLKISRERLKQFFFILSVPILSVAFTTLFHTVSQQDLIFLNDSMAVTSGGFGPNQVSSILGLGVFVCLSSLILFKSSARETVYLGALALFFAASSVITFSRGGIYNAMGGFFILLCFQAGNIGKVAKNVLITGGVVIIFLVLLFPYLNDFTGGALETRFTDRSPSKRTDIAFSDLKLFAENPILGTGVGLSYAARERFLKFKAASHTEFTRIISEHGLFGIFALLALAMGSLQRFWTQRNSFGRALVSGAVVWSSLFMLNAGMRLAAPSVFWGLCFVTIVNPMLRIRRIRKARLKLKMSSLVLDKLNRI